MKLKCLLFFITSILVTSIAARAAKIDQDGVLRNDDGSVLYVNHIWAMKMCPQGTHLPTIRELAELSQASGAKGILESSEVDPIRVPLGYRKVSAIDPDGKWDEFYFNYDGYKRPNGDLRDSWFWSSSKSAYGFGYCYALRDNGEPYWVRHYSDNAVRCIANY